jgi:DNA-binding response OmpR family regulator
MVGDRSGDPTQWQALEAGADHTVTKPITFRDLERILGMTPEERQVSLPQDNVARSFLTVPIGVGAAVVAIAVVMLS